MSKESIHMITEAKPGQWTYDKSSTFMLQEWNTFTEWSNQ